MLGDIKTDNIKVVAFIDPSVQCDEESYAQYLKTLDESLLNLDGEPTRFVLKGALLGKDSFGISKGMIKFDKDQNMEVDIEKTIETVRRSLIAIENAPQSLQWEKEKTDKWTSHELISKLSHIGIISYLQQALDHYKKPEKEKLELLKKS